MYYRSNFNEDLPSSFFSLILEGQTNFAITQFFVIFGFITGIITGYPYAPEMNQHHTILVSNLIFVVAFGIYCLTDKDNISSYMIGIFISMLIEINKINYDTIVVGIIMLGLIQFIIFYSSIFPDLQFIAIDNIIWLGIYIFYLLVIFLRFNIGIHNFVVLIILICCILHRKKETFLKIGTNNDQTENASIMNKYVSFCISIYLFIFIYLIKYQLIFD